MESSYVLALYTEIGKKLSLKQTQIEAVLNLLKEGSTVPFIARYRKEATGGLDEDAIREISKAYEYGVNLAERKLDVVRLITERGMMEPELEASIMAAQTLTEVEDLYRPFKEKKKTRATEAKRKGLEPLATFILSFGNADVLGEAAKYLNEEVKTPEDAILGAQDMIAEMVSDDPDFRKHVREATLKTGRLIGEVKDESLDERGVYKQYYDYESPASKVRDHHVLAMNRAEKEKVIRVKVEADDAQIVSYLKQKMVQKPQTSEAAYVTLAVEDGYKRLIKPSIEREVRAELKEKAEAGAIHLFSENLRQLLMQPPMKGQVVLGIDPAFRTGCKFAVVNATGAVLDVGVVYPHENSKGSQPDPRKREAASKKLLEMINAHDVKLISIGNGTASRETESFVAELLKGLDADVKFVITNEAGASVYSASPVAQKEFPNLAVEERSAASIARRLQDPLAELVKIDPKSIGVGQYQHDVNGKTLNESLDFVVETVVNRVGVNLNTASPSLLARVAGLSDRVAANVVAYRDEIGRFKSRKEVNKVKGLGPKAFEQSVGFLRILDGDNPLDATPIHPESYELTLKVLDKLGLSTKDLGTEAMAVAVKVANAEALAAALGSDVYTVTDILDALVSPNRDLRDELDAPVLRSDVLSLEDIEVGMELTGTVRNIVDFGAFVDVGLKNDGLVHLSQLANKFVKHPMDVVGIGDVVQVWVKQIDVERGRLGLTMIEPRAK